MLNKNAFMLTGALMLSAMGAAQGTTTAAAPTETIAGIVSMDPNFSTLLAAVKAAGLVDTLSGTGPFTVFAPTNAAFAKIPKADLDALLNDTEKLKAVLLYHVVEGKVMAADVVKMTSGKTVNGASVDIKVNGDKVMINDATVTKADVQATNGVVHVIDTVLMPPANATAAMPSAATAATAAAATATAAATTVAPVTTAAPTTTATAPATTSVEPTETINGIISTDPNLTTLLAAVKAADLESTLIGKGPFTMFAPTNAAFAKIPKADLDALLKDPAKLKAVLLYHVVEGEVYAADVMKLTTANTVNGTLVNVKVEGDKVMINDATVTKANVPAINGVVHMIDTVLMPAAK